MNKENKLETREGQKIFEIERISKDLKNNMEEQACKVGASCGFYAASLYGVIHTVAEAIKNGITNDFRTSASLSMVGLLSAVIFDLSARKSGRLINDNFNKLKRTIKEDEQIFTNDEKKKSNSLKKSILKHSNDMNFMAGFEGLALGSAALVGGAVLSTKIDIAYAFALMVLSDVLFGLGAHTLVNDYVSSAEKDITVLKDLMEKPYTLKRK